MRLPPNTSDDVDEDPTGNKALWDRGLLNGASQKVSPSALYSVLRGFIYSGWTSFLHFSGQPFFKFGPNSHLNILQKKVLLVRGYYDYTKHIFCNCSRIHSLIMTKFQANIYRKWWPKCQFYCDVVQLHSSGGGRNSFYVPSIFVKNREITINKKHIETQHWAGRANKPQDYAMSTFVWHTNLYLCLFLYLLTYIYLNWPHELAFIGLSISRCGSSVRSDALMCLISLSWPPSTDTHGHFAQADKTAWHCQPQV